MTEHQKLLTKCLDEDLLDKFQSNAILQVYEFKHNSKVSEDTIERFIDIKAEILRRMKLKYDSRRT